MTQLPFFGLIVLWGSAIYHFIVGVLCIVSMKWTSKVGKSLYGLKLSKTLDPAHEYTLKPLGMYAIFVGIFCSKAALSDNIDLQKFTLQMLCLLFVGRSLMRVIHYSLLNKAFQVTPKRNTINIIFNVMLSAAILYFGISS